MLNLFDNISEWLWQGLIEAVSAQFLGLFDLINRQVGDVAENVGRTPGEFSTLHNILLAQVRGLLGRTLT